MTTQYEMDKLRDAVQAQLAADPGPFTVRQLFYGCVVREAVMKSEEGYKQVVRQLLKLRRNGTVSYSAIADNSRQTILPTTFNGIDDWSKTALNWFSLNQWARSEVRVIVGVEKDALAGIISSVTNEFDVPLVVTRGYCSESYAYEVAELVKKNIENEQETVLYYLGDFDPSGMDMGDGLAAKLSKFLDGKANLLKFVRLAINPQQIKDLKLPARPSKVSDTRHPNFVARFGDVQSTELDALTPLQLKTLVRGAIERHVVKEDVEAIKNEEAEMRIKISEVLEQLEVE